MAKVSAAKFTVHDWPKVKHPDLEDSVYDWLIEQQFSEMPVSTMNITDKAVSLNPNFKDGDGKKEFIGYTISLNVEICQYARALVSVRS